MADDITLTVRVRDLSRGELNRINRQIGQLRQNFNNASQGANAASRGFRGMGQDLQTLNTRLTALANGGRLTRRELDQMNSSLNLVSRGLRTARRDGSLTRAQFRDMSRDASLLRARLLLLGRDGNVFNRMSAHLTILRSRLRDANNQASGLRRAFGRMGDWGLGGLSRGTNMFGRFFNILGRINARMNLSRRIAAILIATLILIGPAAQALGVLLLTALGGAFIALGAFALRGNAEVKSAFQDMRSTVSSVVKEAALPMKDDLVVAIRNVGLAAREMQPTLTRAFTAAGPLINNMFGGITDFAASALPGFTTALEHSEMAMAGFRKAMGLMGDGFGDMFAIITKGNEEELARAWVVLGNEIRNVLESLGEFMSTALNSGTASMLMIGIFRTFTGVLNVMAAALDTVDAVFGSLFTHIADGISGFTTGKNAMAEFYQDSGKSVKDLKKDLADLDKEISKTKGDEDMPSGVKETVLNSLMKERGSILEAIAAKEAEATAATLNHAKSVSELIKQIQGLADLNRAFLDAESAQEAAIDAAVEGYGEYAGALKKTNGQWDLSNKAAQEAYGLLSKVAQTTKEATDKAVESNAPWEQVRTNWKQGYDEIVRLGGGMKLSATDARALATEIMGIPPTKEVFFKARTEEAIANLDSVIAAFQSAPGEKLINVKALGQDAIALLQQIGFQVTQLPDGSFDITAETADAETNIGRTQAARDALKGKNITLSADDFASGIAQAIKDAVENLTDHKFSITATYRTVYETIGKSPEIASSAADALRRQAENFGASGGLASRLPKKKFARGGSVSGTVLEGPGTETSDSLTARLSRGEFVMRAAAVRRYGVAFMDSVNRGKLPGFAKGGKVTSAAAKAQSEARRDLRGQMGVSRFASMAGLGISSMREGIGKPSDLASLVSALSGLGDTIKKAFSGRTESSLLKQLDRSGRALIKYEKKLTDVNKRLDAAKDKLSGLRQEANSLRESVKSGVMSATNITGAASGDKTLTVADLMTKMTQSRDKATAFSGALDSLRKKGVSKEIIQQIAEAGIEGGGMETAGALLTASASEVSSINKLQGQINKAAKAAGDSAAGAMYNAGIKAAEGLVKGLTKQKKSIEKAMMDIAKSMEKAIKRALGIKSPSKVMEGLGNFTAEGFARGIQRNPNVGSAWESMLTTSPSAGSSGMGGSGGNGTQIIYLSIGNKPLDEIILDSNRRTVRTKGGNVQAVYGRKNG